MSTICGQAESVTPDDRTGIVGEVAGPFSQWPREHGIADRMAHWIQHGAHAADCPECIAHILTS